MKALRKLNLKEMEMKPDEIKQILGGFGSGSEPGADCNSGSGGGCKDGCKDGCHPGCKDGCKETNK